jgi:hypothetical protein
MIERSTLLAAALFAAAPCALASPRDDAPAAPARTVVLSRATIEDRLRGGWAGQMIGVSYGSVYEFQALGHTIDGPLRDWKPEFVENSLGQDDLYVEMTFLQTLERHGPGATRAQAAADFRDSKYGLDHANKVGRENLREGIPPPLSGHPRFTPHADDIDFQIESDVFGLIAPGMPRAAGRMCDVFGSLMNYGDGLYGGRFVAAMYSQAYLERQPTPEAVVRCVDAGLAAIPAGSDYAKIIRDVVALHARRPDDWRVAWKGIQDRWGDTDLCPSGDGQPFNIDAKLNGAYVVLGLLYGQADFARTLEITTRCGQDADCNPSTAAGVLGTIYGYERIPRAFTDGIAPLNGKKFAYTDYDYPGAVAACGRVMDRVIAENGGRVIRRSGVEIVEIPAQDAEPPAKLEQVRFFGRKQIQAWNRSRLVAQVSTKGWSPDWKLVAVGHDMQPGVRAALGRDKVLVTHPVSTAEPARLEWKGNLPANRPRLLLTVTSYPEQDAADWALRVLVDGKPVESRVVHSPGKWEEIAVDLSAYASRKVTLALENAAGGADAWSYEAAYWARAEIAGD